MLIQGDCLEKLREVKDCSVDLVYLDPPFFTQKKQTLTNRDLAKTYAFDDTWENMDSYINYLRVRVIECKRVLKNTGSLFLHCDKSATHYLKVMLDQVFDVKNFRSEIIWTYKRWSNSKKGLMNAHQNILFYSKTSDFKFNTRYGSYSATTNLDQILQERERDESNKTVYKRDENGNVIDRHEKKGVPLSDVWEIPYLNPKASERVDYPTQKPILLLERIIEIVTDENDTVLDPFCGSGTTLVAAALLRRNYIGVDISEDAIKLSEERTAKPRKTESILLQKGIDAYQEKDSYIKSIIEQVNALPVYRNKGIDGFIKTDKGKTLIPIYVQRKNQPLQEAITVLESAAKKRNCLKRVLIRTNDIKTLFNEQENYKEQGLIVIDAIDYVLKINGVI